MGLSPKRSNDRGRRTDITETSQHVGTAAHERSQRWHQGTCSGASREQAKNERQEGLLLTACRSLGELIATRHCVEDGGDAGRTGASVHVKHGSRDVVSELGLPGKGSRAGIGLGRPCMSTATGISPQSGISDVRVLQGQKQTVHLSWDQLCSRSCWNRKSQDWRVHTSPFQAGLRGAECGRKAAASTQRRAPGDTRSDALGDVPGQTASTSRTGKVFRVRPHTTGVDVQTTAPRPAADRFLQGQMRRLLVAEVSPAAPACAARPDRQGSHLPANRQLRSHLGSCASCPELRIYSCYISGTDRAVTCHLLRIFHLK